MFRARLSRRRVGQAGLTFLHAVFYCGGAEAGVSVCQSPHSFPCGSLQAENQPMRRTGAPTTRSTRPRAAGRAAAAVAERLGTTPITFPGGHDGFLGGEYGQTGELDAFAATLRQVLTD